MRSPSSCLCLRSKAFWYNHLNDAQSAGDAAPLELRIDAKSFLSADGTPVEVVRGLNLRLEAGSFGALIGPSGCGKTTILRIAAGLDTDFTGALPVSYTHLRAHETDSYL